MLAHTLIEINPRFPEVGDDARRDLQEVRRELEAQAPHGAARDPYLAAHGGKGKQSVNGSGPKKRKAKKTGRKAAV